ncbi:unnamed protein product [Darwinula stevensoni]|uniref:MACPF domain-containing protein n=1 Tax=Darwinula stevensoni TaxID=69355 RepID=A0A7R9FSN1_9CRUS|nr:unnamed protein product [Darwinula stevensoni]CAG0903510.1 unnamed protein product [Darwinula stevensoni]
MFASTSRYSLLLLPQSPVGKSEFGMKSFLVILHCFSLLLFMEVEGMTTDADHFDEVVRTTKQVPEVGDSFSNVTAMSLTTGTMGNGEDQSIRPGESQVMDERKMLKDEIIPHSPLLNMVLINRQIPNELPNFPRRTEQGEAELSMQSAMLPRSIPNPIVQRQPSKRCDVPVPGLSKMARGVDITQLDLTPLDFAGQDGFKRPLFDFTCDQGHKIILEKAEYQLPDQIWEVTHIPGGWLASNVRIYKSYQEIKGSMAFEVGGELSLKKFGFSASRSYEHMQNTITNTSHYLEEVSSFDSAVRADFVPEWVLTLGRFPKMFVENYLPENYTQDPAAYEKFIAYFGTHYFQHGNFGGVIKMHLETRTDYFNGKTDAQVKAQAQASFLKFLSIKGLQSGSMSQVDETFEQMTTKAIRYYGGDTNLLSHSALQDWQPTVSGNPWLFSGELAPISSLIQDANKRASMELAVTNHLLLAYLTELARIVYALRSRYTTFHVLDSLISRIQTLQSTRTLNKLEVEKLDEEIAEQTKIPAWFTDGTTLCYRWYADGNGGQCGGGAAQLLCAKPSQMTSVYRDDSDNRGGGCRMSWSIQSSHQPHWFNSVRVCFRWYPDGDGGQCGAGVDRLLCAPVNDWTPYYRDDTDRRGGGCQMSWMLEVPSSAPVWLQNVKMCFSWYPDGDSGQCAAPSRNLCAISNSWTEYYRDDTDNRSGGCRMSWGLYLN